MCVMYISMFVCVVKRKQQRIQSKYHVGPHTPHQSIYPTKHRMAPKKENEEEEEKQIG